MREQDAAKDEVSRIRLTMDGLRDITNSLATDLNKKGKSIEDIEYNPY